MHIAKQGPTFVLSRSVLIVGLVTVLAMQAVIVYASHQFSDVSNAHPFHDEISAVADAGITTGFPDGTFRPSLNITRQAAAAFMGRGLGRVAYDEGALDLGTLPGIDEGVFAEVTIDAGATGGGNGFVHLSASYHAEADDLAAPFCPCELAFDLFDPTTVEDSPDNRLTLAANVTETGFVTQTGSLDWVVPIAADTSRTFQLWVFLQDADVDLVTVFGSLTAQYVPFGPEGTNALGMETAERSSSGVRPERAPSSRERSSR